MSVRIPPYTITITPSPAMDSPGGVAIFDMYGRLELSTLGSFGGL